MFRERNTLFSFNGQYCNRDNSMVDLVKSFVEEINWLRGENCHLLRKLRQKTFQEKECYRCGMAGHLERMCCMPSRSDCNWRLDTGNDSAVENTGNAAPTAQWTPPTPLPTPAAAYSHDEQATDQAFESRFSDTEHYSQHETENVNVGASRDFSVTNRERGISSQFTEADPDATQSMTPNLPSKFVIELGEEDSESDMGPMESDEMESTGFWNAAIGATASNYYGTAVAASFEEDDPDWQSSWIKLRDKLNFFHRHWQL